MPYQSVSELPAPVRRQYDLLPGSPEEEQAERRLR